MRRVMTRRADGLYVPMPATEPAPPMGDPEVGALLAWSVVRKDPMDLEPIKAELTTLSRDWLVRALSMIGTVFSNGKDTVPAHRALAAEMLTGDIREAALSAFDDGEVSAFLHPHGLLVAVKLALSYGSTSSDRTDADLLAHLLLAGNEVAVASDGESLDHLSAVALRSSVFDLKEEVRYLIPRYHELLVERARPAVGKIGLDLGLLFQESTGGLSIDDYLALSVVVWAMFARFRTAEDLGDKNYGGILDDLGRRSLTADTWDRFTTLLVVDIAEAAVAVAGDEQASLTLGQVNLFRERPLIRLSTGEVVPVWLPWLQSKIGDGLRWTIQGALKGDTAAINRFTDALGALFEDYAYSLLARLYPDQGNLRMLYPEQEYKRGQNVEKSNDATLFVGDAAIFFEFTITAPRVTDLFAGDTEAYRQFIRRRFLEEGSNHKLLKLGRRIEDFLSGALVFESVDRAVVRRIYPVLVTLVPWPRHRVISRALGPLFESLSLLRGGVRDGVSVRPWRLISIEEMEMLEGTIAAGNDSLEAVLAGWVDSTFSESSLNNYLLLGRGWTEEANPYLRGKYQVLVERIKGEAASRVRLEEA